MGQSFLALSEVVVSEFMKFSERYYGICELNNLFSADSVKCKVVFQVCLRQLSLVQERKSAVF